MYLLSSTTHTTRSSIITTRLKSSSAYWTVFLKSSLSASTSNSSVLSRHCRSTQQDAYYYTFLSQKFQKKKLRVVQTQAFFKINLGKKRIRHSTTLKLNFTGPELPLKNPKNIFIIFLWNFSKFFLHNWNFKFSFGLSENGLGYILWVRISKMTFRLSAEFLIYLLLNLTGPPSNSQIRVSLIKKSTFCTLSSVFFVILG